MQTILSLSRISEIERVFMKTIYHVIFSLLISTNSFAGSTLVLSNFAHFKSNPNLKSMQLKKSNKVTNIHLTEGGVSDGGGGTTSPQLVSAELIADYLADTAPILIAWFNREEMNFQLSSDSEKIKSTTRKLFTTNDQFRDIIRNTKIEIKMSEPCYDQKGQPHEGSIYASIPNAICLSPFLMSQKLNENNFEAEMLGLVLHELSHLVGTTEDEATKIQREALWTFYKINFFELRMEMLNYSGLRSGPDSRIRLQLLPIQQYLDGNRNLNDSDIQQSGEGLAGILNYGIGFNELRSFLFLQPSLHHQIRYSMEYLYINLMYFRMTTPGASPEDVEFYRQQIQSDFKELQETSIAQILLNSNPELIGIPPAVFAMPISRPVDLDSVKRNFQRFVTYWESAVDQISDMTQAKFQVIKK